MDNTTKSRTVYLKRGIVFENAPITFNNDYTGDLEYQKILESNPNLPEGIKKENTNSYGSKIEIIDYKNNKNVTVLVNNKLNDGIELNYVRYNCRYEHFKTGSIKSPYDITVQDLGYMGEGYFNSVEDIKAHNIFKEVMKRCNLEGYTTDPYFYNFQNFCLWFQMAYYEFNGERMEILEDIYNIGSKHYHPYNSVFVPQRIKILLKSTLNITMEENEEKYGKPYKVQCMVDNTRTYLGSFNDRYEALTVWKNAKEEEIKRVANYYFYEMKGQFIPQFRMVYDAMMNHKINIDII